jgi:membrane protease YdiL (CAAX protease family)
VTTFQQTALVLAGVWLALVVGRFRRSVAALIGGLVAIGAYTLAALLHGDVTAEGLGLGRAHSWPTTVGFALAGSAVLVAYSPVADRLASQWVKMPPNLEAFRALQQSRAKLVVGIVVAWILGGFLEELVVRGVVLKSVQSLLSARLIGPVATGVAVCTAAAGAGAMHLYQGPRAAIIVAQLSVLFGVLFVASGHNLWAVILCHGLYDTIAIVRFAAKKSKYSELDRELAVSHEPRT